MAVTWDWKSKCGEIKLEWKKPGTDEWNKDKFSLYSGGNCLLVILNEYRQNGEKYYNLQGFFDDKTHMNKCLGISKGWDNKYKNLYADDDYMRFKSIRLLADKNSHADVIAKAFKKARPDLKVIVEY